MTLFSLGQQILVEPFNFIIYSVTFLVVGTTMKLHDIFCFYIDFDIVVCVSVCSCVNTAYFTLTK